MSTIGRKLLSAAVYSGDVQEFMGLGLTPALFKESEGILYSFVRDHLQKYGKLPSPVTIEETQGLENALVEASEPPAYYLQGVERRYLQNSMKAFMNEAGAVLKEEGGDPMQAFDILLNGVSGLNRHKNRNNLIDFRDAAEMVYGEYVKQKTMGDDYGLMFGWPSVDEMTGGLKPGDFASFVGRPASGKTFKLLYNALNAWDSSKTPLFFSMEMSKTVIMQRMAAMYSHKPLTHLMKAEMTTKAFSAMMEILQKIKEKQESLWIVDGNLATTVDDIIMLTQQLKPSAIYVDGAYLLRHPNPRTSRFERQTENAEWLKQRVATDLGIPVVASYQFSKEMAKKQKAGGNQSKAGLEDIYGSDAIAQLSTMVFGLMQEDSVETQKERIVEILKGRNGETGRFRINWDFQGMDFTEKAGEEEDEELMFCD